MDIKIEDYLDEEEIKEICKVGMNRKIEEERGNRMEKDMVENIA